MYAYAYAIAALLAFTPPSLDRARPVMALISGITEKGELITERGTLTLAGVTVTKKGPTEKLLKELLLNKVAKVELEPETKAAHVFVSSDCAAADKLLGQKSEGVAGQCVRSLYVNEVLVQKKWAKPAPDGVTRYRERLFRK